MLACLNTNEYEHLVIKLKGIENIDLIRHFCLYERDLSSMMAKLNTCIRLLSLEIFFLWVLKE